MVKRKQRVNLQTEFRHYEYSDKRRRTMRTSEDIATLGTVEYMGPWGGFSDR